MPGVAKRKNAKNGKYRIWYLDERGRRKFATGHADRKASERLAQELEQQCRRVREGLAEPGERHRKAAAAVPVADHAAAWRLQLEAKGDTARHAAHASKVAARVLANAGAVYPDDIRHDLILDALGRLSAAGKSPRTRNHALGSVKAFVRWLVASNRLRDSPRGMGSLKPVSQEVDRKRVRRSLTADEFARLIAAAESGPPVVASRGPRAGKRGVVAVITGPDRAMLYRVAAGTGFRANELRSLTPASFDLDGDDPSVTVAAAYSKRKRTDVQPLRRDLAALLRPFLAGRDPAAPVWCVPVRTAEMLAADLARAGVPVEVGGKVADFHSIRNMFVTGIVRGGADAATAQKLARHSDVRLTLSVYTDTGKDDLRKALEGEK